MKRRYFFLLVFFGGLWLFGLLRGGSPAGTSFSTSPQGSRALFAFFAQLGVPAERWLHPFEHLQDKAAGRSTLFMIDAGAIPAAAVTRLVRWVEQGNRLMLLGGESLKSVSGSIPGAARVRPLAESMWRFERHPLAVSCTEHTQSSCHAVHQISSLQHAFMSDSTGREGVVRVAGQTDAPQVIWSKLGEGDVWLFAEAAPALNDHVDKFDNARLLYQAATAGGHTVLFDEFHHGYTAPVETRRAGQQGLFIMLAAFLVAAALAGAVSRGVRFGPPLPASAAEAPGTSEFAAVLGLLYREHGAVSALCGYLAAWKRRVQGATGISARLDDEKFARAVGEHMSLDAEHTAEMLTQMTKLRRGALAGGEVDAVISHLEQVVERGRGWSILDQQRKLSRS